MPMKRYLSAIPLLALILLSGCLMAEPEAVDRPSHHTADGFDNPWVKEQHKGGFFRFWRMRLSGEVEWPEAEQQIGKTAVVEPDLERIHNPDPTIPQATWIGHSTVLIQQGGKTVLTDPVFSDRASPVSFAGPKRYTPPGLQITDLPPVDMVVISHNHYDHLDVDSIRRIGAGPLWLVPLKNAPLLREAGIPDDRIVELDWWQSYQHEGFDITLTPAQHWSARGLYDRKEMLWGGWAVDFPGGFKLWYAGDTGYAPEPFQQIGERLGPFDFALIPIGGYEPRGFMRTHHINPEEAVRIQREVGADRALGVHWGAFVLTAEPADQPPQRLAAAVQAAGLPKDSFVTLAAGETMRIPYK